MTRWELRRTLLRRGVQATGSKAELVERIRARCRPRRRVIGSETQVAELRASAAGAAERALNRGAAGASDRSAPQQPAPARRQPRHHGGAL